MSLLMTSQAYGYIEEEVHFSTTDGITLTGYLAKPNTTGPHPAVIIQLGSGRGTTDNKNRKYNPFADLGRTLADQGFLTLRFDKRGTGYNSTNGSFEDASFEDYVSDLKSAVKYVLSRKDTSKQNLFLMGHSLGGPVVSRVAAETSSVRGVILSATPGRNFLAFNAEQLKYYYEFGEGIKGDALSKKLADDRKAWDLLDNPNKICSLFPDRCSKKGKSYYYDGQSIEFWKQIKKLDPIALARKLHCPVFVFQGNADWAISSESDAKALYSEVSHTKSSKIKIIDGMDHFFSVVSSKQKSVENFYNASHGKEVSFKLHPAFLQEISAWLKELSVK